MTEMTDARLVEIERRANAATEPPWNYDERVGCVAVYIGPKRNCLDSPRGAFVAYQHGSYREADRGTTESSSWTIPTSVCRDYKFIAHAREDVPELVAEVRAQDKRIVELEAELARLRGDEPVVQLGKHPPRDAEPWTGTEPSKAQFVEEDQS